MVIYLTTNLINDKKYIGKDIKNNPKYLGSGVLLKEAIKQYGKENFKKEILEFAINDEDLIEKEIKWIKYYDAVNSNDFYNLVEISGGWNFEKCSKEKYELICQKIGNNNRGIPRPWLHTDQERKNKLRLANKGKPKPQGFGNIISNKKTGQKFTDEHKQNIRNKRLGKPHPHSGKSILQLDKEDNILNEFKSIEIAANSNSKYKRSNISCCLTGVSKTAYGFKWIYKEI